MVYIQQLYVYITFIYVLIQWGDTNATAVGRSATGAQNLDLLKFSLDL